MDKTILHWSYRDFKEIPEDLKKCDECLEEVYLKENFISSIPLWLFQLKNLKFIHLAGNLLKEIPEEIHFLENLEFLDISENFLRCLPSTIGALNKLKRFNVSGNYLKLLPETIGQLKLLEILNISANVLRALPVEIGHCHNLVELILSDNLYLQSIPERVSCLPKLEKLCADRCELAYLPGLLSESIIHLRIFNNRFLTHIPMAYEKFFQSYYNMYSYPVCQIINTSSCYLIKEKQGDSILRLPNDTRLVLNICSQKMFSLFENCLRTIDNFMKIGFRFQTNGMPTVLTNYIKNGPSSECSSSSCRKPLFSEYYLLVVKRFHGNLLFTSTFCSCQCAKQWILDNQSRYYVIDWEIF